MKSKLIAWSIIASVINISCSNNKAAGGETDSKPSPLPENKESPSTPASTSEDGIVGEWKLSLETFDDNNNKSLDDEERKKGIATSKTSYRFNADGSGIISNMKFKGEYEVRDEGARKLLTTYIFDNGKRMQEGKFYILSVNKDELVLLHASGEYAIWVFKRAA